MEIKQSNDYLDISLLEGYLESLGKTVVEKMIALYCQQAEIYLNDIENAQINDEADDWQSHCHKMKGAAASVGMCKTYEKVKSMEKIEASQVEKAELFKALKEENDISISAFNYWLAAQPK